MDWFGFSKDDESENAPRNCSNCNSGILTSEGMKCCINKTGECIGQGEYRFWTPIVEISGEWE